LIGHATGYIATGLEHTVGILAVCPTVVVIIAVIVTVEFSGTDGKMLAFAVVTIHHSVFIVILTVIADFGIWIINLKFHSSNSRSVLAFCIKKEKISCRGKIVKSNTLGKIQASRGKTLQFTLLTGFFWFGLGSKGQGVHTCLSVMDKQVGIGSKFKLNCLVRTCSPATGQKTVVGDGCVIVGSGITAAVEGT
jgi:hypothetical protein